MNGHYTEEQIESIVGLGGGISDDEHLQQCRMCREKYLFLAEFHRYLEEEIGKPADARVQALIDDQRLTEVIELRRYYQQEIPETDDAGEVLVLAARHAAHPADSERLIGTYVSQENGILMRVLYDDTRHFAKLIIGSEKESYFRYVRLGIRKENGETLFVSSDGFGRCRLDGPENIWQNARVFLFDRSSSERR